MWFSWTFEKFSTSASVFGLACYHPCYVHWLAGRASPCAISSSQPFDINHRASLPNTVRGSPSAVCCLLSADAAAASAVDSLSDIVSSHSTHLAHLRSLALEITDPETPFDRAKSALEQWRDLGRAGDRYEAVREWEDLVDFELSRGGQEDDDNDNDKASEGDEERQRSARKKKGKR